MMSKLMSKNSLSSILYCFRGKHDSLLSLAAKYGLDAQKQDPWSVRVTGAADLHNSFLDLFENNCDFGILYDEESPNASILRFRNKLRRMPQLAAANKSPNGQIPPAPPQPPRSPEMVPRRHLPQPPRPNRTLPHRHVYREIL